jgi:rod shape-determining protein MreB
MLRRRAVLRGLSKDLAIDLGTSSTIVYAKNQGIVACEPSTVVRNRDGVFAVGGAAEAMAGRTPRDLEVVRPIRNRVVTDFDLAACLIAGAMAVPGATRRFLRPRVAMPVSAKLSPVERRAARESARVAGAREVHLIPQAIAGAVGAGLPAFDPPGNMIIDVGGGGTEVSVISLGELAIVESTTIGGEALDQAIIRYLRTYYGLQIGARTAERIKCDVGSVPRSGPPVTFVVKGQDVVRGTPAAIELKTEEVMAALEEPIDRIVEAVRTAFLNTPAELAGDLFDRGAVLLGGGAKLPGLEQRLRESTGLPVIVSEEPDRAVALGAGRILEAPAVLDKLTIRG